jgi:hypothetical protein
MFEEYIQDAHSFFQQAETEANKKNEREARKLYRASIFCAASAMEAFMNYIGDTFKQGDSLDRAELAFINDKVLEFSPTKLKTIEKVKYNSLDEKVKFIIKRFSVDISPEHSTEWNNFVSFKKLRDSLIHSKNLTDDTPLSDYQSEIKKGLNAIISIIDTIFLKLFNKPLRKSIKELTV